jgi:DNA-binding beta-propeller fold protein YncE/mono/diheme cytochrome c family protein
VGEAALYVADEDHKVVRRIPIPVRAETPGTSFEMPGAAAAVLPLDGRVLATVREPGLLLVLHVAQNGALSEERRVELPQDAWGLSVTADERTAIVTSAWSQQVSAVDLETGQKRWSVDVAREPRGVVVTRDGIAYVTHLVGGAITRIENINETPKISQVLLPPAPLRSPSGVTLDASLGYAALLSPDESRLFVARHALGALGEDAWFGASTIDVLLTKTGEPLAPRRHDRLAFIRADKSPEGAELIVPPKPLSPFTQPRALAWRSKSNTLLVASEGDDLIAEVDALALDPTRSVVAAYRVSDDIDPVFHVANRCGAPSGVALSDDENEAWVFCRSTYDLATVRLIDFNAATAPSEEAKPTPPPSIRVAEDTLDADAAMGRRLFYNATDRLTSGGLGCAGCHPDGRDDGHVWREAKFSTRDGTHVNFVGNGANIAAEEGVKGAARRTPMLAGRVNAAGPYGWHGESKDLVTRLVAGFGLHRWGGIPEHTAENLTARALRLTLFLRKGLIPPAGITRELDDTEKRGKALFASEEVGCSVCHVPETEFTNRAAYPFANVKLRPGYDDETNKAYKTPSLRFLVGRAPYFHDGRATSLQWLIDNNDDKMGKTNHLSGVDRQALIAYLRTL